jgi:NADH:ubiquinone oxidoreductase subunit 5 (subunit L)/multisubunit Na+/H+ antiporter MnhA subunit
LVEKPSAAFIQNLNKSQHLRTAGVFLLARTSPLLEFAPYACTLVTIVGAITTIFAGTIGLVQNDFKSIIAYSTCSQLGYMVTICGLSNYNVGIFHLFNHAFFKALRATVSCQLELVG